MNKREFLARLQDGLSGLPREDIEERVTFFSEMLEDRMEEGLSEEEAVSAAGSVDEIIGQIVADTPLVKIARERILPQRRLKPWEILLLVLGSPVWLSLGIAALAVFFAVYVSLWAILVSLWAVFGAVALCAAAAVPGGAVLAARGSIPGGLGMISAAITCAGLAILLFFACRAATKAIWTLTKKITVWTKNRFMKKETA